MDQPIVETSPQTNYISNPIDMIKPSTKAIGVNVGTLFALLGMMLIPGLVLLVAILFGVIIRHGETSFVAMGIGLIALASAIGLGLLIVPAFSIVIMAAARGEKITARAAMSQASAFVWRALGINILTTLAVLGGFLLFIVPGFIFMAWFSLSLYVLVTEDLSIVASMKRSRALVRGRVWEIWGLNSLAIAVTIVPVFGSIANLILSILMIPALPIRYLQLAATKPEDRPQVHWVNYAIIVLAILAGGLSASTTTQNLDTINNDINSSTYSY